MASNLLTNINGVSASDFNNLFIPARDMIDAVPYAAGTASTYEMGIGLTTSSIPYPFQKNSDSIIDVAAGRGSHTLFLTESNRLYACGWNYHGQFGNNSTSGISTYVSTPVLVSTWTYWRSISVGGTHSLATRNDGTLWSWGAPYDGQLGVGDTFGRSSPTQVGSLNTWDKIAASYNNSFAIKTDGTLWAWGKSTYGLTCNSNPYIDYYSPVQIGTLNNWKQVDGFADHAAAVKTDGTLWAWGSNWAGQLGIGNNVAYYSSPVQVGSLTDWESVAVGTTHTAAIKKDGTLWAWGYNVYGQLGISYVANYYSSPVQIGSLTNWKQIDLGYSTTYALRTDGTLWSTGINGGYELGLGSTNAPDRLSQIQGNGPWYKVAAGYGFFIATKALYY